MVIIGGTYRETTVFPRTNRIFGSALKAAAALASVAKPTVISCIDDESRDEAESVCESYGISAEFECRESPIEFAYYTPVSIPDVISGNQQKVPIVKNTKDNVLLFGMIESDPIVTASAIVFDPQHSNDLSELKTLRSGADRFAIVANSNEIRRLGKDDVIYDAAAKVIEESGADVIIVKRGALGARVIEANTTDTFIECYHTNSVWPIGSGDVFSAVFAWSWLEDFKDVVEAAHVASAATSVWCATQTLPINLRHDTTALTIAKGRHPLPPVEVRVPVYLAGPFFTVGQTWLIDTVRYALEGLGAKVFSPLHDVGLGGDEVAKKDIDGLLESKSVLALLDGADSGTLYEVGYAASKGIPTVGYSSEPDSHQWVMLRGLGAHITDDLSTAVYRSIWAGMR